MSLSNRITEDLKAAMRQKDQAAIRAVRAIKSAILLAKTEENASDELSPEQEIKLVQKLAKQREDSIAIFQQQQREDLASSEIEELEVLKRYLPTPLSDDELDLLVQEAIAETGASSKADMGKVIGLVMQKSAGGADGKRISKAAAAKLG